MKGISLWKLLTLLGFFASACKGPAIPPKNETERDGGGAFIRVEQARVLRGGSQVQQQASGIVDAWQSAHLRAEAGGRIISIEVEEGEEVKAGQVLLRMDASKQRIAVSAARAQLDATFHDRALAQSDQQRKQDLFEKQSLAEFPLERAKIATHKAEAAVKGAQAQLASAKRQLQDTVVKAPIGGVIASKMVSLGDVIIPGAPLLDIVDLHRIRVHMGLAGHELARLQRKEKAELAIRDLGGKRIEAAFVAVSPRVNPVTGLFEVEYQAENSAQDILAGMVVSVQLPMEKKSSELLIPREAITRRDGRLGVFEIREGRVYFQPVRTGSYDRNLIEVLEGLSEDSIVANSALHALSDGLGVDALESPLERAGGERGEEESAGGKRAEDTGET